MASLDRLLPDSLRRRYACPFECCIYGEWKAESVVPVHAQARSGDVASFSIPAHERFTADSGFVFITGVAIMVLADTVRHGYENPVWLLPNDTLVLLEYLGEGFYNVLRGHEVIEQVPAFYVEPEGMVGDYQREWWVHATYQGRSGWIAMDSIKVAGADACGGPID